MFNQTASTPAFGSGTNASGGLFGGSSTGATFGTNTNSTSNTSSFGGFGQNQQNQQTQSTPSFGFGTNNNNTTTGQTSLFGQNQQKPALGASGTGSSLFGQQQTQQTQPQASLFGASNTTTGSSLFSANKPATGNTLGSSFGGNQNTSLFSNPTPVLPVPNPNESLFQKNSLFSVSSSDADAAKFRESLNGQQMQNQNQNQNQPPSYANTSINNTPNPSMPLRHSQSSITLGNGSTYRRGNTPSWATEKRFNPSTPSNMRHVSSFNTAERAPLSVRKASPSSPTNSFGSSFSGVSKPSHPKKKAIIQEDPPPSRSIYDTDASNLSLVHKADTSMVNRRTSMTSTVATPISSTPRPVKTLDHSLSVVIFGFPSSVTPAVVAHFSRFGTISENVDSSSRMPIMSSPNKSLRAPPTPIQTGKNWLKITYDNPASASRAIQENGTLIAGQYVVGCIPVTAQNYRDFETASETSMQYGLRSPSDSIGEFSIFDDTTADFTDGNILPPSVLERSEDHSAILAHQNGKSIGRTVSMPSLAGSKRVDLKDGRTIFNKAGKQVRYSPSLFKISQEPDQDPKAAEKNHASNGPDGDKRLQAAKPGWMSWTSKKAQELVFGWDNL